MKFLVNITILLVILASASTLKLRQTEAPQAKIEPVADVKQPQATEAPKKVEETVVAKDAKVEETKTETSSESSSKTETEVKTEVPPLGLLVNTPPAQPSPIPQITRMDVLDNNGNVKNIQVHDDQKDLENAQKCKADLLNTPVYQLCKNLKCDECLNTVDCGWCGDGRCLPGNLEGAKCPGDCLNHWFIQDQTKCPREINSGTFSNVAPEATKLINPELTEAKLKLTTTEQPEVKMSVHLVTGAITGTATQTVLNADGSVDQASISNSKPMTSELVRSAPTDAKTSSTITSLATGERLDLPDAELKQHGVDQVNAAPVTPAAPEHPQVPADPAQPNTPMAATTKDEKEQVKA